MVPLFTWNLQMEMVPFSRAPRSERIFSLGMVFGLPGLVRSRGPRMVPGDNDSDSHWGWLVWVIWVVLVIWVIWVVWVVRVVRVIRVVRVVRVIRVIRVIQVVVESPRPTRRLVRPRPLL